MAGVQHFPRLLSGPETLIVAKRDKLVVNLGNDFENVVALR